VVGALGWAALSSFAAAPHYLAYFNELAGGPGQGLHWLADSNLDWGQALRELPRWLDRRGITEVNLCYFGTADPDAYGLRYVALPGGTSYSHAPSQPRLPGYVAISATHLAGIHHSPELRAWYRALLARAHPVGVVAYAIHVFYVPALPPEGARTSSSSASRASCLGVPGAAGVPITGEGSLEKHGPGCHHGPHEALHLVAAGGPPPRRNAATARPLAERARWRAAQRLAGRRGSVRHGRSVRPLTP
jgi:hypothetical protein